MPAGQHSPASNNLEDEFGTSHESEPDLDPSRLVIPGCLRESSSSLHAHTLSVAGEPGWGPPSVAAHDTPVTSYCQWQIIAGTRFVPTGPTSTTLPPGLYIIDSSPAWGTYFSSTPIRTDGLVRFEGVGVDSPVPAILAEIQKFWDLRELFAQHDTAYKRSMLLYGPPGGGKSSVIRLLLQDVIHRGGIGINFKSPMLFLEGYRLLRQIQPIAPLIVVLEDIEAILKEYPESDVLNILDGVERVDGVVFLATTNYPQDLQKRIVNRPGRFDKRFRLGMPNEATRLEYLFYLSRHMTPTEHALTEFNAAQWAEDTPGLSLAHLRELFNSVVLLDNPYQEVLSELKSMKQEIPPQDIGAERIGLHK